MTTHRDSMASGHWAEPYIGKLWRSGAAGPEAYDCWHLVRAIQRERFGRDLPSFEVDAENLRDVIRAFRGAEEYRRWHQVTMPAEGDVVEMGHARYPWHAGLWVEVDGGGVLHCTSGAGAVFQSLAALQMSGWGRIRFFRWGAGA